MTTAELLKAKLTPEEYAAVKDQFDAAVAKAFQRGKDANGWAAFFRGCWKSWTQRIAVLAIAWPAYEGVVREFAERYASELQRYLPTGDASMWISILGGVFFLLRIKTVKPLEERGAPTPPSLKDS